MSQRIDLYRDDLRPVEATGELPRALALLGAAVIAMLAWGGWSQYQASTTGAQRDALMAEQADLQARSEAASQALARRVPDPALTAALAAAQQAVDGRRWIDERLRESSEEVRSFSGILEGLGRQRPAPLWLTRIHVGDAGARLGLGGGTVEAEAVPAYLQALSDEPALSGQSFGQFLVGRGATPAAPFTFELATDCEALADGCNPVEDAPTSRVRDLLTPAGAPP